MRVTIDKIDHKKSQEFPVRFLVVLCVFFLAAGCQKRELQDEALAVVGKEAITQKDFVISYELTPTPYLRTTEKKTGFSKKESHLDWLIEKKLFAKEAVKRGLDQDPKVQKLLQWYEKKAAIRQLYREVVQAKVKITEQELRKAYVELNETVHARHLFTKDEQQAWKYYYDLKAGVPFQELARQAFKDSTLANHGGDLGEFTWGDFDPEFEEAVFKMKPGEISTPVHTRWGYHVVKLESRKRNPLLTETGFQSRKSYITKIIKRRKEAALASKFIKEFMEPKNVRLKGPAFALLASSLVADSRSNSQQPRYLPRPLDPELLHVKVNLADHLNDPLVEFAGGRWSIGDFLQRLATMPVADRPNVTSRNALKNGIGILVRDAFLGQEALRRGLERAPLAKQEFAKKKEELLYLRLRRVVEKGIAVTEEEVETYFAEHREAFREPEQVNICEVLVRSKQEAEKIKHQVEAGADISELAKKRSIRTWAAKQGGVFGFFPQDRYGEIGRIAFAGQVGDLCGPVEVAGGPPRGGYSIFKIVARKPPRPLGLDEVKDKIRTELLGRKKGQAVEKLAQQLKKSTPVQIDERKLASLTVTTDWAEQPISVFAFDK
ncbi:MAG: peptidylprolyl isomerase [bacterium]